MTREEIRELKGLAASMGLYDDKNPCKKAVILGKAIEALEQESILDKIRAEMEQEYNRLSATRADETLELGECLGLKMSLKIIDKYKAESED